MLLKIDNELFDFMPVEAFRRTYRLPSDFGIAKYVGEAKEHCNNSKYIQNRIGAARTEMLHLVPERSPARGWANTLMEMQLLLNRLMSDIHTHFGLPNTNEAVIALMNVLQQYVCTVYQASFSGAALPCFTTFYEDWLHQTMRPSNQVYLYQHRGQQWLIQLIHYAYGWIGFLLYAGNGRYHVYDPITCPAEPLVKTLLNDLAARFASAIQNH